MRTKTICTTSSRQLVRLVGALVCALFLMVHAASAQTTKFTYQGRLTDANAVPDGNYDMQFKLFDTATDGNQVGPTVTFERRSTTAVAVTNGAFTVQLDFGAEAFPGADRFLEIAIRYVSDITFTPLAPRQQFTSKPYAIRSLNSTFADRAEVADNAKQLAGAPAKQYVKTDDLRLFDARRPVAGSSDYIQNTTNLQKPSNFNISGDGTVGGNLSGTIVNATTQYNLGGQTVLRAPGNNLFAGFGTGLNTTGSHNSVFGSGAGQRNTFGSHNAFFGWRTGQRNTMGDSNSFVGSAAGYFNETGNFNSFVGSLAGVENKTGSNNSFVGFRTGNTNKAGMNLTLIGSNADVGSDGLEFATAIGSGAVAVESDMIVIGKVRNRYNGVWRNADTVQVPGNLNIEGTLTGKSTVSGDLVNAKRGYDLDGQRVLRAPGTNLLAGFGAGGQVTPNSGENLTGNNNSFIGESAGFSHTTGDFNSFFGSRAGFNNTSGGSITLIGSNTIATSGLNHATAVGADALVANSNTVVLGRAVDTVRVPGTFVSNGAVTAASLTITGNLVSGPATVASLGVTGNLVSDGRITLAALGTAGITSLCRNLLNQIANCSSSLRYKTNIAAFSPGLSLINRLRPISFDWKAGGLHDVGFGAEEVAALNPMFVTYNSQGQVEGVKYDRLSVLFVNAFKEQQAQIKQQQNQIEALKQLVCLDHPQAAVCK